MGRRILFDGLDDLAEVVHLEVAGRCQLRCPYCYLGQMNGEELPTAGWCRILSDVAGYGVFQVTFGGGEPTLRNDLKPLALHARSSGLNLCMTTNGLDLSRRKADTLCLFNQVNVSYHHAAPADTLRKALKHLTSCRVPAGINLLLTKEYVPEMGHVAEIAKDFNAELLLLSAKGVPEALGPAEVLAAGRRLHEAGVRVAVDGLSCRGVVPDFCLQKVRFCTVDGIGNVMPCSFVRTSLGNLRERSFAEIWRSRGAQVPCSF